VVELSHQTGYSISQIVMGYIMSQPIQTFPIIGFDSTEQLQDTI
jgi:aryl-alcohol dehydrogenase-like predicted oxidoreductase